MRSGLAAALLVLAGFFSPVQAGGECTCYWQLRSPVRGDLDSLLTRIFANHEKKAGLFCLESCTMEAVAHLRDTIEPTCRFKSAKVDACSLLKSNLHVDVALSDEVKVGSTEALRRPYVTADACTDLADVLAGLRDERRYDLRACLD